MLNRRYITTFSVCLAFLILIGCADSPNNTLISDDEKDLIKTETIDEEIESISDQVDIGEITVYENAEIHFIDVGQGDATLLRGPDFTILIDAGRHDRTDVVPYLQENNVQSLDLVIGTHPHADHIGQIDQVLNAFPVNEVWLSGDTHTTRTFERALNAIIEHDVDYYEPRAGETFQIGSLHIIVVNPVSLTGDFHEGSIGVKATYGDISILFTGDAEKQTEDAMLQRKEPIEAQIFQLGHHGSSTSNTEQFLRAVNPEVAIYSAGVNNSYGHPHREVIEQLNKMEIPMYGTPRNGSIIVTTDGKTYTVDANVATKKKDETVIQGDTNEGTPPLTGTCIDINTATLTELQKIIHIGTERAEQLIEFRPYSSVNQLTKINGIGSGRLNDIKAEGKACVN